MKILILGIDGYIGYPLSLRLKKLGHEVWGLDNFVRRSRAKSLTPNRDVPSGRFFPDKCGKLPDGLPVMDAIVHLAEQPSAPWSMASVKQAEITQRENVLGTLELLWSIKERMPDAHLLKLGSMGEYGTPDCDIPEGFIESGELKKMMFPRQPNSFYHLSKVFDSMNIEFACRTWGLRSTDVMQGIVFGLNYWDNELTRFDYDEYFGTVINRFCAQAVSGIPLTVYGKGGQKRGFLPLSDSIQCLTLALENPPEPGEYRVFNQFSDWASIEFLAWLVKDCSKALGTDVRIRYIDNPRVEQENHYYNPKNEKLKALGYEPKWDLKEEIKKLIRAILPFKDQIDKSIIQPTTRWK